MAVLAILATTTILATATKRQENVQIEQGPPNNGPMMWENREEQSRAGQSRAEHNRREGKGKEGK